MKAGREKIVVAMSGGVDSSVAAALLVERGYDVQGVSLRMWEENQGPRVCSDHRGAAVLGPVTVGRHSRVGAGSVLVSSVPQHSTVVGIPGRVVQIEARHTPTGKAIIDLNSADLPDPVAKAIGALADYVEKLEKRVDELGTRQGGLEEKTAEESEVLNKVKELLKNTGS